MPRPEAGEQSLVSFIRRTLSELGISLTDPQLAEAVSELSDAFNGLDGASIPELYMENPRWRSAYLAYFFPSNAFKAYSLLLRAASELKWTWPEKPTLLDFGCGPGSAALGAVFLLREAGCHSIQIHLVDRSPSVLRLAQDLLSRSGDGLEIDVSARPAADTANDIVLAFNVLAEMEPGEGLQYTKQLLETMNPGGHLIIAEPALREKSRRLAHIRDHLMQSGLAALEWPCLHQNACPGLDCERDWCHGSEPWERPDWIADLDRAIGNRKTRLNYSSLILGRIGRHRERDSGLWRVVSDPLVERGKRLLYLCGGPDGRRVKTTLLDRHVNEANADFSRAERYDLLQISGPWTEKGDGFRLDAGNMVRLVTS